MVDARLKAWHEWRKCYVFQIRSIRIDGDIILGGVFPVHSKETRYYYGNKICGDIAETRWMLHKSILLTIFWIFFRGVHRVEAMMYAIDKINNDTDLLRGMKLVSVETGIFPGIAKYNVNLLKTWPFQGALIMDSCSTPAFALNQSLDFVRDLIGKFPIERSLM